MKKITSLSLGFSFLIMSYTGIMLFLCPKGKVAYWADWHLFGLSKTQYGDIHTTSMITFLFFGVYHTYYNWNPILNYLKDVNRKISFTKKEFLIALLINIFFVVGTLYPVHPMKAFMKMGETIKDSWTEQYGEPPYGHAEESKLKVFCRKLNIDFNIASKILSDNNIIFKDDETLLSIGKNNNISPSYVYKLIGTDAKTESIKYKSSTSKDSDIPSRLGRKTLKELSDMRKIDLDKAINILKLKGLDDINSDSKIKNIADELDLMPIDVYKLLIK
ncbi:MAG: DUF4405 domain-containing protein [Arcobacteraceae bacterium]|nr:DUF4405 domain-containing protein [Arcobacteraceae bacterium]